MKVLVCGGRGYSNEALVFSALDCLHASKPITKIVEGGAGGADRLARKWSILRLVPSATYRADWKNEGRMAGPMRNVRMFVAEKPDIVVAFPGGRGTAHMISVAMAGGCPVIRLPLKPGGQTWQPID